MKAENLKILQDNQRFWEMYKLSKTIVGLGAKAREDLQRVMSEEFQPGYTADLWCPSCAAEMLTRVYNHYERWQDQEKKKAEIKVTANFPSHKNHKRSRHAPR